MTVTFWAIVSAMTYPSWAYWCARLLKRPAQLTSEQEKTLPVYRQQFSELEQDLTNGLLTDEQYQTARHELERRVLEETGSTETSSMTVRRACESSACRTVVSDDHSGSQWRALLDIGQSSRDDAPDGVVDVGSERCRQ